MTVHFDLNKYTQTDSFAHQFDKYTHIQLNDLIFHLFACGKNTYLKYLLSANEHGLLFILS